MSEPAPLSIGEPQKTITCKCGCIVKVEGLPPFSMVECPQCETRFPVGVKLGQFLLLKRLGHGAMGQVFEAKDLALGRHVAIKIMGKKVSSDEKLMADFLREARTLARLNHRNIVQIHSIGMEKGTPYLIMELVSGGRMDQMIVRDQPGDEGALIQIGIHASAGLDAASGIGLVHGDIKPANILIDKTGEAKIVDFGLARFADNQVEGKVFGTPFYIAPELLQGRPADHRSDMYSLGSSLFHALAGRPAFRAKTVREIVRLRLKQPAPNVRQFAPQMHPETANVIARMLEMDPDDRYGTYGELIDDLNTALAAHHAGPISAELADLHEAVSGGSRTGGGESYGEHVEHGGESHSGDVSHHAGASATDELSAAMAAAAATASSTGDVNARASRTGRVNQRASRTSRVRSRAGRTGRVDGRAARSTQHIPAGTQLIDTEEDEANGLGVKIAIIATAVLVVVGIIIAAILFSGGGGESEGDGGAGGSGDGGVTGKPFTEPFTEDTLGEGWRTVDGGGEFDGGAYLLRDERTAVADSDVQPAIERTIGPGSYTADVDIAEITWAGGSEALLFDFMDDNRHGLQLHVYNAQGECYLEAVAVRGRDKSRRKHVFDALPKSLKLTVDWSAADAEWTVHYGVDGAEATQPLEGDETLTGDTGRAENRTLRIGVDQYGSRGATTMKVDFVRVRFD